MSDGNLAPQLTPELLVQAYKIGYFPMAEDATADEVFWVRPEQRGVLPLDRFHLSRSLAKTVRQDKYRVSVDQAFEAVVTGCGAPHSHRESTWINDEIHNVVCALHRAGIAHSIEAWAGDTLVGGLYGLQLGGAFFGESMFSIATDASKVCLVHLVGRMKVGGFRLLDTQFQNDHLVQFGTEEIHHDAYMLELRDALEVEADLMALPDQIRGSTIVQSITQTS